MKQIDTHAHIFTRNGHFIENARYRPQYDALLSDYLAHLDAHQMDCGVLIQPSFFGFDNSQMAEGIAQYPHRLKGVAVVPYDVSPEQIRTLSNQGMVGARLNLFGQNLPDIQSAQWHRFLSRLSDANWQLELHCPPDYLQHILPACRAYSCPVVIDHFGRIDAQKGIEDACYQNVIQQLSPEQHWIKISGFYRLGLPENAMNLARAALILFQQHGMFGNLIWGSDWPHTQHTESMSYHQSIQAFHQLVDNEEKRKQILSDNAQRLFGF